MGANDSGASTAAHPTSVSLLTGGADQPYVYGLATALISRGVPLDLIGSDELDCPEFHNRPGVNFLNLRGNQRPDAGLRQKASRILVYYARLIRYAGTARPKVFHILWNNKFEHFDRTLLMAYYRRLGKKIVLTVHNVNAGIRDRKDSRLNRFTLRIQYRLADHIFVHTKKMKLELTAEYGVPASRVTVIPFGINNAAPNTRLTSIEAKQRLGLDGAKKIILFFGSLAPYKGVEILIAAFRQILTRSDEYRLVIAGSPDIHETYWRPIRDGLQEDVQQGRVLLKDEFIPDPETEVYFKAADVLVLPYRHIYQSGVLFLGHSFGLPVIAADVGSLKDDIVEGETGLVFRPEDADDLARTLDRYFASDFYGNLASRRAQIRDFANARHSWHVVSQLITGVYTALVDDSRRSLIPPTLGDATDVKPLATEASLPPGHVH